jgi:hypothetical protein
VTLTEIDDATIVVEPQRDDRKRAP